MYLLTKTQLVDLRRVESIEKMTLNNRIRFYMDSGKELTFSFETIAQRDEHFDRIIAQYNPQTCITIKN